MSSVTSPIIGELHGDEVRAVVWHTPAEHWPTEADAEHEVMVDMGGAIMRGRLRQDGPDWIVLSATGRVNLATVTRWRFTGG